MTLTTRLHSGPDAGLNRIGAERRCRRGRSPRALRPAACRRQTAQRRKAGTACTTPRRGPGQPARTRVRAPPSGSKPISFLVHLSVAKAFVFVCPACLVTAVLDPEKKKGGLIPCCSLLFTNCAYEYPESAKTVSGWVTVGAALPAAPFLQHSSVAHFPVD